MRDKLKTYGAKLFGVASLPIFLQVIVFAGIGVYNFTASGVNITPGLDVYQYETITNEILDSQAEFDAQTISTTNFVAATDDLETVAAADDYIRLNHYGDNEPNVVTNNWWDDDADATTLYNWRYRKCFAIDHTAIGATNLTEYQIYLDIDTTGLVSSGKMAASGADIRFADSSGSAIDYYIADDMNTASTRIWIRPSSITAGTSEDVCMYYGYTGTGSPVSASDREAVFSYASEREIYYIVADDASGEVTRFASYIDGNDITLDNTAFALDRLDYDEYPPVSIPFVLEQITTIPTTGPLNASYNSAGIDNITPVSAAGTKFVYSMYDRVKHILSFTSPWCTASIAVTNDSGNPLAGSPFTVTAGTGITITPSTKAADGLPKDSVAIIEEVGDDCPVLAYYDGDGDFSFPLFPAHNEWYGVGSENLEIAALQNSTSLTVYRSTGTSQNVNLNRGQRILINDGVSDGGGPAHRIVSNNPVGVNAVDDGDGKEATTFLPADELGYRLFLPEISEYISIATIAGKTTIVDVFLDGTVCGVGTPDYSLTANATGNNPGKVLFNATVFPAGTCVIADNPIYAYNENDNDGAEHNLWSEKQNRQFIVNEPTATYGAQTTGTWTLGSSTTFSNREAVVITNNSTTDALDQYQVKLDLSGLSATFWANVQTNGGDFWLAGPTGDGTDNLVYNLEDINVAASTGTAWVEATIPSSSSSTIYAYYNSLATIASNGDNQAVFNTVLEKPNYVVTTGFNLAGRTLTVVSHQDNTTISDGISGGVLSEAEVVDLPLADTTFNNDDTYAVKGPLAISYAAEGTDSAVPISFAGTEFVYRVEANNDAFSFYAPFEDANVTIQESNGSGYTTLQTVSVTAGATVTVAEDITNGQPFKILSDEPILATHGTTNARDAFPLYPVDKALETDTGLYELYGVGSEFLLLAASSTANVTIYRSNGTQSSITLNSANDFIYTEDGIGQNGTAYAYHITSDAPIGASSFNDRDGDAMAIFLPQKELSDEYILPDDMQYLAIATDDPSVTCRVYDAADVEITTDTSGIMNFIPPQTSGTVAKPYPNKIIIGGTDNPDAASFYEGYRLSCTEPVFAYGEHYLSGPGVSINDEKTLLTWSNVRQRSYVEPIAADPIAENEEGLYFESGFDSAGAGLIPQSYFETTIDSADINTFWYEVTTLGDLDSVNVEKNSVDGLRIESASSIGPDCATGTYTAFVAVTTELFDQPLPDDADDNRCLRLRVYLQTGDPAYSPEISRLTTSYVVPTLMTDQLTGSVISVPENTFATAPGATDKRWRVVKVVSSGLGLDGGEAITFTNNATNQASFFNLNAEIRDLDSGNYFQQHSFPTFPALPVEGDTDSTYTESTGVALYIDYSRQSGTGSVSDVGFGQTVGFPAPGNGLKLSREFTVNFSGL